MNPQHSHQSWAWPCAPVTLALERQRHENPWDLPVSQPSRIGLQGQTLPQTSRVIKEDDVLYPPYTRVGYIHLYHTHTYTHKRKDLLVRALIFYSGMGMKRKTLPCPTPSPGDFTGLAGKPHFLPLTIRCIMSHGECSKAYFWERR